MLLIAPTGVAFAFDDTRPALRVGVLRGLHEMQDDVAEALRHELRARGIDAFDAVRTYDEAIRDGVPVADYYVEIMAAEAYSEDHGSIGVGTRHGGVSIGVLVSRVVAELRVYDANMELLESRDLRKRNTAVVPTSIGVGGRSLFAYIALPMIERAQLRRVVKAAGRAAAGEVLDAVR